MANSILVAYATKYGSTKEVAEAVAQALRECGSTVEVMPVKQVRSLEGYRAVVLGAPLYIGSWPKDAQGFLKRFQAALASRPVAVFTLGPLAPGEVEGARDQLDKNLGKFPWLKPVAAELFVGAYDPAKLRFPDSLILKMPSTPLTGVPASDHRDWAAIKGWANNLAGRI